MPSDVCCWGPNPFLTQASAESAADLSGALTVVLDSLPPDNHWTLVDLDGFAFEDTSNRVELRNLNFIDSQDVAALGIWYRVGNYVTDKQVPPDTTILVSQSILTSLTGNQVIISDLIPNTTYFYTISVRDTAFNWADLKPAFSTVTAPKTPPINSVRWIASNLNPP